MLSLRGKPLRLVQAVILSGVLTSTCSVASDDEGERYTDVSPILSGRSSPVNNNNNEPQAGPDSIDFGLEKLHLNRSRLAIKKDFVLGDAQKMTRENLTELTSRINDALVTQVAVANISKHLEGPAMNWITQKNLTPEQVLRISNNMIGEGNNKHTNIKEILAETFTVIRWTEWKKTIVDSFIFKVADRTQLTPIIFADFDAMENAIQPHYRDFATLIDALGAFIICMAKEEVTPVNPAQANASGGANFRHFLEELAEAKSKKSSLAETLLEKRSEKLYKHLLKTFFVGAKEHLAEQKRDRGGLSMMDLLSMMNGRGGAAHVRVVHVGGDLEEDDNNQEGNGCHTQ